MSTLSPHLAVGDVETICAHVSEYGASGVETGGMLVTDDTGTVRYVALAGTRDVRRGWGLFQLQASAIAELFDFVEDRDLHVAAMFHSHKHQAFLSEVDQEQGINMSGFTSIVVPDFAVPPRDVEAWGWWDFDGALWVERQAGRMHAGASACVVEFDAGGVREL